jgi:hypothetical protein
MKVALREPGLGNEVALTLMTSRVASIIGGLIVV